MGLTIEEIKQRHEDGRFVFQLNLEQIKELQQEGFFVIATHDGACHADDVFATVAFRMASILMNQKSIVVRSRKKEIIEVADALIDVGGMYNPERYCFDHHQEGDVHLARKDGSPKASFGLVWSFLGLDIVSTYLSNKGYDPQFDEVKYVFQKLDKELVQPIDAYDCGVKVDSGFNLGALFAYLRPSFIEIENGTQKRPDNVFEEFCVMAELIIKRFIGQVTSSYILERRVTESIYDYHPVLILDFRVRMSEIETILKNYPHITVVIVCQNPNKGDTWTVNIPKGSPSTFPKDWLGKSGDSFAHACGLPDVDFCHVEGFTLTCKSKETAILLANEALVNTGSIK